MVARRNSEERRGQIVEGLLTVMETTGYEGATTVAIAQAAGLTPGLVHYHFPNKEAVLLALVEHLASAVRARHEASVSPSQSAEKRLHGLIDAYVAHGKGSDRRAVVAWSWIGAEAVRNEAIRGQYQRAIDDQLQAVREHVKACFEAAHPSAALSAASSRRIAATIVSAIEGALRIGAVTEGVLPAGFAATMIKRLADTLIAAEARDGEAR
jgi:TetR/AcrR family transcriptional regulator, transcriptional repressor of bet genes